MIPNTMIETEETPDLLVNIRSISYSSTSFDLIIENTKLYKGEIVSVIGSNGAGKSTLFEILLNIRRNKKHDVQICQEPAEKWISKVQNKKSLGTLLQYCDFPMMIKVREIVELHRVLYQLVSTEILESFQIAELLDKKYHLLSRGQKQRVDLYFALAHLPQIAFLDEPTSGLDSYFCDVLYNILGIMKQRKEHLIVQISQNYRELLIVDKVLWLKTGRLIAIGSPGELIDKYLGSYCVIVIADNVFDFEQLRTELNSINNTKIVEDRDKLQLFIYCNKENKNQILEQINNRELNSFSISKVSISDLLRYATNQ